MERNPDPKSEEDEVAERTAPSGNVIYRAIYDEGEHELSRSSLSLALSGLAAGFSMGCSFLSEGLLQSHLPQENWTKLLTKFGYSLGFIIVILGRQQLFTKNTLTVILPLLQKKELSLLGNVLRLWAWVLIANLIGTFFFAWLLANTSLLEPDIQKEFSMVALASIRADFLTMLLRGILAGWLIALMVWLLPFAETARIWVVVIIAYLIGIAGFPHVIAGSVETFYLVCRGELSWLGCLGGCFAPTLVGNVVGGVALVAVGAHAEFGEDTPGNR